MDNFNSGIELCMSFVVCLFVTESHYITQEGFEILIFLASDPQVLEVKVWTPGPRAHRF